MKSAVADMCKPNCNMSTDKDTHYIMTFVLCVATNIPDNTREYIGICNLYYYYYNI